jgi:hypothetical protein
LNETAVTAGFGILQPGEPSCEGDGVISAAAADVSNQTYHERRPGFGAGALVACVWVQAISSGGSSYEHRTVPTGSAEISYALGKDVIRVSGPTRSPSLQRLPPGTTLVGVRFRPGVASAVLGTPMSELVDLEVELELVWGRSALLLAEQLADASSAADAAHLLEHAVIARSAPRTRAGRGHRRGCPAPAALASR